MSEDHIEGTTTTHIPTNNHIQQHQLRKPKPPPLIHFPNNRARIICYATYLIITLYAAVS